MRVESAIARCHRCEREFSVLRYVDTDRKGWSLFSDGYLYYPNAAAPWHVYKICPHCSGWVEVPDEATTSRDDARDQLSGDAYSPRERIRAVINAGDSPRPRRELLLLDLWISNHICGEGPDKKTRALMSELLTLAEGELDPVLRADILRQLGRFDDAREQLHRARKAEKQDPTKNRRIHLQAISAMIGRRVRDALAVTSDPYYVPPTGRLAIHQGAYANKH